MKAIKPGGGIPSEMDLELEEGTRQAMSGVHDTEEMRKACERMDRMREEVYQSEGILDIAVLAIRELRGELPDM